MMTKRNLIFLLGAVGLVIGLGILASFVGNVGIRRVAMENDIALLLSEPVVPGVPTTVKWRAAADQSLLAVTFSVRGQNFEQDIITADVENGAVGIVFPCAAAGETVSLIAKTEPGGELVGWRTVEVLAAGPDCF